MSAARVQPTGNDPYAFLAKKFKERIGKDAKEWTNETSGVRYIELGGWKLTVAGANHQNPFHIMISKNLNSNLADEIRYAGSNKMKALAAITQN